MRSVLLFLFMSWVGICFAQPAGTPLKKLGSAGGKTWAVVIGISDYQDKDIPDLRFAHRDAEAFATWLQSPAGGGLNGDQLQVLLNDKATAGRVAEALDALLEHVQENEKVFIYFSGHGDVERKTLSQPGFLLCWDAPSRVYMGGGTYSLAYLQEVVATLSLQNKAKVTVIADACRAGKLAGSQIGGPQLTSANLQRQQANEMKILSCQSKEYSIEGTQWGGGRGVFSYHLMDGLYGLADRNDDGVVTLGELDRYLEDHVTAQAAPISQVPVLLGNKTDGIATIHEETLEHLSRYKSGEMNYFTSTDTRGLEDDVLAKLDSGIIEQYKAFNEAVMEKRFFPDAISLNTKATADELYTALLQEPGLSPLFGAMTRNYAAALQDDTQQTLNTWLKTSQDATLAVVTTKRLPLKVFTEKVMSFPRCLDRAAELLGDSHYMYDALKARKFFFEGYILANSNQNPDKALGEQALALFRQSLDWQKEQPQVYWQMSRVFGYNLLDLDSLESYTQQAMEVYPNWLKPCLDASYMLSYKHKEHDRAKPYLQQANQIDSKSAAVLHQWAVYNSGQKNFNEAEQQLLKAISQDSTDDAVWNDLANLYYWTGRFSEAEPTYKKAIAFDSTVVSYWSNLGNLYQMSSRYMEAEEVIKKALSVDSIAAITWSNLGSLYNQTNRYAEAEPVLHKSLLLDSTLILPWNNLGYLYNQTGRYAEAEHVLLKAVALDSNYAHVWNNLGFLYIKTNRYTEAEVAQIKAISFDSTVVSAWNNLGHIYMQTRRFTEVEPVLQKAIALDSTFAGPWNYLGISYIMTKRFKDAEPVLKKVVVLDSTNVSAWNNLGYLYIQTRQYAEGEPVLKKAIEIDPNYSYPRRHLGMVCFKLGRSNEALQNFLKALELNPNYTGAMLGMAYVLFSEGSTTEAIDYVEQAIGKGSTLEQLQKDEDLAPLREKPEWKELMKKHFPDQGDN